MIARFLVNVAALAVATYLVPGIWVDPADKLMQVLTLAGVALIFGVVNTIVKPLFRLVTSPLIVVTLGLFLLVINGLLLEFVAWIAGGFGLGWHVDDWEAAFWGALVVSVVSVIVNAVFRKKENR